MCKRGCDAERVDILAGLAERAMLFDLQQVRRHLTNPEGWACAQERVTAGIEAHARVVVAHSLGVGGAHRGVDLFSDQEPGPMPLPL